MEPAGRFLRFLRYRKSRLHQPYRYVHNLQGDIIAIVDAAGNTVVQYTYGAWGEKKNVTGIMATTLGKHNPFRYRGYVYIVEALDKDSGVIYSSLEGSTFTHYGEITGIEYQ